MMRERIMNWYRTLGTRIDSGTHPRPIVVEEGEEHVCLNCGTHFRGDFCPGCGQRGNVGRLTVRSAIDNLLGVLASADKGLGHTIYELLLRPGHMMRDYVRGHRTEYTRPIQLLFLLSTVYLVVHYVFFQHAEQVDFSITDQEGRPIELQGTLGVMYGFLQEMLANRAFMSLGSVALMVLPMWLAFRQTPKGKETSLVEFFFVMVYVSCQQMVFNILQLPFDLIKGQEQSASVGLSFFFMVWSFHQYYEVTWRTSLWRCLQGTFILAVPVMVVLAGFKLYLHYFG